jgi:opacity protein-like surface antigen
MQERAMKRVATLLMALSAVGTCAVSASASAQNLLGLYAGAGIGESTVRSDYGFDPYYPDDSHPHHTAAKAIVGIRPIPFLGAEAEYIDFGHPSSADSYYDHFNSSDINADSHPKAGILYGVGYVPLPFMDVFAKAGVARLETNLNTYTQGVCTADINPGANCGLILSRQNAWQTRVAYGAGVQAHFFSALAVRGEYERISSTFGDPDAFMVSATWTF